MPCDVEETGKKNTDLEVRELKLPEGVPPLTSLYIYASGACNLACQHCWIVPKFRAEDNNGQHIRLDYVKKAIREAKPLGLSSVKLTGGEPTIHPHFRDIISFIEEEKLNVTMETNGVLIDEDLARFLKGIPHFSSVSVSLDGAKPETNDWMRGVAGSYQQALSGVKHLIAAGFRPQIICTLHRGNVAEMTELIDMAENLGCGSVKFNLVQHIGRGRGFAASHGLRIAEIIQLNRQVETEIAPKYKIPIFFDIPIAFFPIHKLLNRSLGKCGILNVLGLLSGGEMALCGIGTTRPELIYGHIADDDLQKVWYESPKLKQLREQIPGRLEGICARCLHRDTCLGTCVANNFHESGRLNAAYFFCQKAQELGLFPQSRQKMEKLKRKEPVNRLVTKSV